jgi:hypothetical protein
MLSVFSFSCARAMSDWCTGRAGRAAGVDAAALDAAGADAEPAVAANDGAATARVETAASAKINFFMVKSPTFRGATNRAGQAHDARQLSTWPVAGLANSSDKISPSISFCDFALDFAQDFRLGRLAKSVAGTCRRQTTKAPPWRREIRAAQGVRIHA